MPEKTPPYTIEEMSNIQILYGLGILKGIITIEDVPEEDRPYVLCYVEFYPWQTN